MAEAAASWDVARADRMGNARAAQDQSDIDESRFRVPEGFDYSDTVNWALREAMASPRGSRQRIRALEDLNDLLYPKRDARYGRDRAILEKRILGDGKLEISEYDKYGEGLLYLALGLMERRGLLGGTDIDDEPF